MTNESTPETSSDSSSKQDKKPEVLIVDAETLRDLPPEVQNLVGRMISQEYRGPLPLPAHYQEYERILPGAADRILSMAEKQSEHRHQIENKAVDAQIQDDKADRRERFVGQLFGFIIGMTTIIAGALTAAIGGQPWAGGVIGTGGVVALVAVFVLGRSRAAQEKDASKE